MAKVLFLAWQDSETRRWLPVGRLLRRGDKYVFSYTKGATVSRNFVPFGMMKDLNASYESDVLFPLFSNRILDKTRPEYVDYLRWLNVDTGSVDPFYILSLTEGLRGTDGLEIFPCPEPNSEGLYDVCFFSRSLRHLNKCAIDEANQLRPGDRLYIMHDYQNKVDEHALALRTGDPATIVGYCPRYLCQDFYRLLKNDNNSRVEVVKVNLDAPLQMRLLCNFRSLWPNGFSPCADESFALLDDVSAGEVCHTVNKY